jgi:hypothetical protein
MKNFWLWIALLISLSFPASTLMALDETALYQWVLELRSYKYDPSSWLYGLISYGSSVAIGGGRIVTNAHVIFDDVSSEPYGTYEACESISFEKEPRCFTLAKLDAYDLDNDLAVLTLEKSPRARPLPFTTQIHYPIGSPLIIYGYPGIGGSTTTRTAGRIAWYDEPFYKIDGIIDHGNSWGGAFSLSGELLGIPSRIIADTTSLGYMIPTATVETFLAKKTPGYTVYREPVDSTFRTFLTKKYREVTRAYVFKNSVVNIPNMKKYGVKFVKNAVTNASDSQVFLTFLHEKKKVQFFLMCGKVAGSSPEFPYWKEEMSKNAEIVSSSRSRFTTVREYSQKDQYSYMIFDKYSPCFVIPATFINPKKDWVFLAELERFFDEGVRIDTTFEKDTGFHGSAFSTEKVPKNMLLVEYPTNTGKGNIGLYIENSLGDPSSTVMRTLTFTREKDLLEDLYPYQDIWKDPKLTDLSSIMYKNKRDTENVLSGTTRSWETYYISYDREEKPKNGKSYANISAFIILPPGSEKYGYLSFYWGEQDAWLDQIEIDTLKGFFDSISLRDQR